MGEVEGFLETEAVVGRAEAIHYIIFAETRHFHALDSAEDSRQKFLRLVADKQKEGVGRRFLEHLQQFVGASLIHALGQPDDNRFPSAGEGHEGEFAQNLAGLALVDGELLGLNALVFFGKTIVPVVQVEIPAGFAYHVTKISQVVVANRFVDTIGGSDGEDEVQVGVLELGKGAARGTFTACVVCRTVLARDSLRVGQSQGHFSHAGRPGEELRVSDTTGL